MKDINVAALLDTIENAPRPPPPTLPEALSIRDDDAFAEAIVDYVCSTGGVRVRPVERIVYLAIDCWFRIARGGINDVLVQAEYRDEALDALHAIGALREEGVLRRGAKLFDDIDRSEYQQAKTIGDLTRLAGRQALDELNDELGSGDEIRAHVCEYVIAHRGDFALDGHMA